MTEFDTNYPRRSRLRNGTLCKNTRILRRSALLMSLRLKYKKTVFFGDCLWSETFTLYRPVLPQVPIFLYEHKKQWQTQGIKISHQHQHQQILWQSTFGISRIWYMHADILENVTKMLNKSLSVISLSLTSSEVGAIFTGPIILAHYISFRDWRRRERWAILRAGSQTHPAHTATNVSVYFISSTVSSKF